MLHIGMVGELPPMKTQNRLDKLTDKLTASTIADENFGSFIEGNIN